MKKIAKQRIFDVEPYRPGKPIDEVKRELKLKKVIKLASNENAYGPSPKVYQAMLKEGGLGNWEGRKSPLSVDAFDRALLMDRYRLQVGPAFGEGVSEESRWKDFYRVYHPYYTNGYVPTAEFRINMGVFYLLEGDLRRAHTALEINRFIDEDFWIDRRCTLTVNAGRAVFLCFRPAS